MTAGPDEPTPPEAPASPEAPALPEPPAPSEVAAALAEGGVGAAAGAGGALLATTAERPRLPALPPPGAVPPPGPPSGPPPVPPSGPPPVLSGQPSARWVTAVVALATAIALVVVLGGGYAAHLLAGSTVAAPAGGASQPAAVPSAEDPGPVTLTVPGTLDGRPAIRAAGELQKYITDMSADIIGVRSAVREVSSFYSAGPDLVGSTYFVARQGTVDQPRKALDDTFTGIYNGFISGNTLPVTPGPLGGYARCSDLSAGKRDPTVICGWADRRSVGVIVRFDADPPRFAERFAPMRGSIEQRA